MHTVLIVDDDADVRRTLMFLLEGFCRPVEAASGDEALRLFAAENPSLVLLDLSMPGLNGLQVLSALHSKKPALPIVMLTSATDIDTAKKALGMGAVMYMTKPFDVEALKKEVRGFLNVKPENPLPWKVKKS